MTQQHVRRSGHSIGDLVAPGSPHWTRALQSVPHEVYHLPAYVESDARLSEGVARAFVYSDERGTLLVPLVLRSLPGDGQRCDVMSPYGYPGPSSDCLDVRFWRAAVRALVSTLSDAGAVSCFVRLDPLLECPLPVLREQGAVVQHGLTVSIDLRRSPAEIWSGFRANHRRQIVRARRDGRQVVIDDWRLLPDFISCYHETMTRVGASDYYFFDLEYFNRLREALGPALHLFAALGPDGVLGGGLFFEQGGIVQYHLGGTRTGALREQPTKLVFDEVWRWARARGNVDFHLGAGVGGEDNPLFHFKAGFSDRRHPFHTWRVVVDADAYEDLVRARDRPAPSGYFPAYRSPDEAPARPRA